MINDHKNIKDLCRVLLLLKTENEVFNFLKDLCTPAELIDLSDRWQICIALNCGTPYRAIRDQLNVSLTTIGRVARSLKYEPYQGYKMLLQRLTNNKD